MAAAAGTGGKIPPLADRLASVEKRHANMARWAERVNERLRELEELRAMFIAHCGDEGAHRP